MLYISGCVPTDEVAASFLEENQELFGGAGSLLNLRIMSRVNESMAGYQIRVKVYPNPNDSTPLSCIPGTNFPAQISHAYTHTEHNLNDVPMLRIDRNPDPARTGALADGGEVLPKLAQRRDVRFRETPGGRARR